MMVCLSQVTPEVGALSHHNLRFCMLHCKDDLNPIEK